MVIVLAVTLAVVVFVIIKPQNSSPPTPMPTPSPQNLPTPDTFQNFTHRSAFVRDAHKLVERKDGTVVSAENYFYLKSSGATSIPDLPDWLPFNDAWVGHFGTVTTAGAANTDRSNVDNTAAIRAALDYIKLVGGGYLYFGRGYYRVTAPLVVRSTGTFLIGAGDKKTYIFADHTLGPILQITTAANRIENLCLTSSSARRLDGALDSNNYGLLYQTLDDAGRMQNNVCQSIRISNQPSHGLYITPIAYTGSVINCWLGSNGGHGVLIDKGTHSGINPPGTSGLVSFRECEVKQNDGHAFALGNPNNTTSTTQALRVEITNCEIGVNAGVPEARWAPAYVYLHGATEVLLKTNVLTGDETIPEKLAGIFIAGGRSIHIINNRFIDVKYAVVIDSYATFPTIGVFIEGFNVINSPELQEAVLVQNTTGDPTAAPRGIYINNYNFSGGVNTLVATGEGMDAGSGAWRVPELGLGGRSLTVMKRTPQQVTNSTQFVEDEGLKFWIAPRETIVFSLVVGYVGPNLKVRLTVPDGVELVVGPVSGVKVGMNNTVVIQDAVVDGTSIVFGPASFTRLLKLVGTAKSGGFEGKVALEWAQASKSASTTQVLANVSYIILDRVVS